MKAADALSKDARALLRAARGGDDISVAERQRVLEAFRQRVSLDEAVDAFDPAAARAPRIHGARASHGGRRRALPRPVRRVAWALAAVISTGSLAALAREGAFDGWGAAIERVFGTLAGESSTREAERGPAEGAEAAARGVSPAGATETTLAEAAGADERVRSADEPVRAARESSSDAERATQPAGDADDGPPAAVADQQLGPRRGAGHAAAAAEEAATDPEARASATRTDTGPNESRRRLLPSTATQSSDDRRTVRAGAPGAAKVRAARSPTSAASRLREPARAASAEPSASDAKAKTPAPPAARASEELDLIVAARNALAARRHADARAAAERHAERFPRGMFAEEREAILALCACRETGAKESARSFVERRPDSLFAERIREDCKLVSNLVPGEPPTGTH